MNILDRLFRKTLDAPRPGVYHYQSPAGDPRNYRLHLRVEPDLRGLLVVNAATVLHLNETAAEYAYHFVHNQPGDDVARSMAARYHVDLSQATEDYQNLADRIITLIETPDLDPVTFLDFDRTDPNSGRLSAPLRLDCALTYRLPEGSAVDTAPIKRVDNELTTAQWREILDKAWEQGIPHIIFTGGEPTLRDDLPQLIQHAEGLGQVTGLLTNGLRLSDPGYLYDLLQTGLDHMLILAEPANPDWWQALKNALAADVFTAVHITITPANRQDIPPLLRKLADLGVPAVSLSAADGIEAETIASMRSIVDSLLMSLVWDLPVPYSAHNPVALELAGQKSAGGAGRTWLYLEPDGDVLPSQGVNQVLGNILRDRWTEIWKS